MFSQIIATGLLALSVGAPTRQNANVNSNLISGAYNLDENFNSSDLIDLYDDLGDFEFEFTFSTSESVVFPKECLLSFGGNPVYYVSSIYFHLYHDDYFAILECEFDYYTGETNSGGTYLTGVLNFTIEEQDTFEDVIILSRRDTIFSVNQSFFINDDESSVFNFLWTREDNSYVTTYSGYYNFVNNLNTFNNRKFIVLGTVSFNGELYYGMLNNTFISDSTSLFFVYYDYNEQAFVYKNYSLPLYRYNDVNYNNVYLTNCKMSISDYNDLSNLGVFAFSRDTSHDNDTFHDLLFGVMDSPIYFLSRLMSFELFGINMFVAFTGLLTLCVVLVLIRKF